MQVGISVLIFVASFILIGQNLNEQSSSLSKPFWGEHDWNGVRYGNIARNYLRYGFIETKFGQIENSGPVQKNEFEYFTHYPPLLPILISVSYMLFGISEWSTRIVPTFATSGIIVLIFLIGLRLYNFKFGILAVLLGVFTPMVLYFGKTPVHEPLVVFFVLFAFYCYLKGSKLIWLGLILAEITTWAGFFLIPAVTLVELVRKNYGNVAKTLPLWVLSITIFLFHLGHTKLLTGDFFGGDLFGAVLLRSGISVGVISDLNPAGYIGTLRLWVSTLYTNTLLSLVILWLVSKINGFKDQDYPIIILGIFGITYFILFPNAGYIHNYLTFYLLPFFALAGASGLFFLTNLKLFKGVSLFLIFLFFLGIFFERRDYLSALEKSNADKLAVEVGKSINKQTDFNDIVIVSPVKFSYSADKFLRFYGDRKIIYSNNTEVKHDVRVIVDQDEGKFEIITKE